MVNQQLLDYIKQQLQQDVSREQIKSSLVANGWQAQDIEEGFNAANPSAPIEQDSNFSTKAPIKMWKIIIASLVGVLIVGCGIYFSTQKFFKPVEKSDIGLSQSTQKFQLNLDIITPKDIYNIGEKFTGGKYLLNYNGDSFKAIILYVKSRKGFENKVAYSQGARTIETGDFDSNSGFREVLQAFRMDETGFEVGKDSFQEAGEYIFTVSVYRCSDIGLEDKDCSARIPTEFILKFKPLNSISKIISVIAEIPEEKTTTAPSTSGQKAPVAPVVLDCKQDLDCFIQASQNCKLAKVNYTATIDIFGAKQTNTSFFEIKGMSVNKCIFYLRTEKIDLTFPSNVPSEVVGQQKEIYKKLEGRDGTCKFNTSDLTAMLTRWEKGTFESGDVSCKLTPSGNVCKTEGGDFGVAECQGTYFEQPSL